jgi:hypothetical protein
VFHPVPKKGKNKYKSMLYLCLTPNRKNNNKIKVDFIRIKITQSWGDEDCGCHERSPWKRSLPDLQELTPSASHCPSSQKTLQDILNQ